MSAKKMTPKEREMSQAIMKNIQKLMSDRHITKHKDVYDNIPAFTQSQFSNVINGTNFPTMMQLIGLADFFNVSIDFLLDRNIPDTEKEMSLTDCCESIAQIMTGKYNARLQEIEVVEIDTLETQRLIEYPQPHYYTDYDCQEHKRTYKAIYFSEQTDEVLEKNTRPDRNAYAINKFLKRLTNIISMNKRGDLDADDYNLLLKKYLQDVKVLKSDKLPFLDFSTIDDTLPFD